MKRKRDRKNKVSSEDMPLPIVPDAKPAPLNQVHLPVFDFSKRSHQAAFWMLINRIIYDRPDSFTGREITSKFIFRK